MKNIFNQELFWQSVVILGIVVLFFSLINNSRPQASGKTNLPQYQSAGTVEFEVKPKVQKPARGCGA